MGRLGSFVLGTAVASGAYLYTRHRVYQNAQATQSKLDAIRAEVTADTAPLPPVVAPPLPGQLEALELWASTKSMARGYWNRWVLMANDEVNKKLKG